MLTIPLLYLGKNISNFFNKLLWNNIEMLLNKIIVTISENNEKLLGEEFF